MKRNSRMKVFLSVSLAPKRRVKALLGAIVAVLTFYSATAQACTGPELQKTLHIIQTVRQEGEMIGNQCLMSADYFTCVIEATMNIGEKYNPIIESLSPSCQWIIQNAGGNKGPNNGPLCSNGVCCDNTGCY